MNEIVKYIFFFLIGTTVLNLFIAIAARLKTKYQEYNLLITYWIFLFLTYFATAILSKDETQIGFAFFFHSIPAFILIRFLSRSRGLDPRYNVYIPFHIVGLLSSAFLLLKSSVGFTGAMLPMVTTMALPFFEPIWNTLVSERKESNWIEKCMAWICLSGVVNMYNYAFFRLDPNAAWWGWSVSIAQYQSMSVFLPLLINHHRGLMERMHVGQVMEKLSGPQQNYDLEIEELYRNLESMIIEKDLLNKKLSAMNTHLEEEREMNEILIKTISHDIANPLTVVKSYVELVQSGRIPKEDYNPTIEKIKQNCISALGMIKRIRNAILTRNQSSITEIKETPLFRTLNDTLETFDTKIKEKEIAIKMLSGFNRELYILADEKTLKEHVLSNVISNAIKFSYRKSTIKINVQEIGNIIRLEIIDSGIGMTSDRLEKRKHQPFEGTEGELGSGLGFVLMGYFLRKFGGSYQVLSEGLEKGTTIRLDLLKSPA